MRPTTIFVNFQKEGIHCYPAAINIPGVEFLSNPHRHLFHFRVEVEVTHDDRDIEFILFKRWLESLYNENILLLDYKSCEMIANELIDKVQQQYPIKPESMAHLVVRSRNRKVIVTVSEDGENGATVRSE